MRSLGVREVARGSIGLGREVPARGLVAQAEERLKSMDGLFTKAALGFIQRLVKKRDKGKWKRKCPPRTRTGYSPPAIRDCRQAELRKAYRDTSTGCT